MASSFLEIKSMSYDYECDIVSVDFLACRVGSSLLLEGFADSVIIPVDINQINNYITFSIILDASTSSNTNSTTYIDSEAIIDFGIIKGGSLVNIKLLTTKLLGDGVFVEDDISFVDFVSSLLNTFENLNGFEIKIEDSLVKCKAPINTGVYYNGFTIQVMISNNIFLYNFSGGKTIFDINLSGGVFSKYKFIV